MSETNLQQNPTAQTDTIDTINAETLQIKHLGDTQTDTITTRLQTNTLLIGEPFYNQYTNQLYIGYPTKTGDTESDVISNLIPINYPNDHTSILTLSSILDTLQAQAEKWNGAIDKLKYTVETSVRGALKAGSFSSFEVIDNNNVSKVTHTIRFDYQPSFVVATSTTQLGTLYFPFTGVLCTRDTASSTDWAEFGADADGYFIKISDPTYNQSEMESIAFTAPNSSLGYCNYLAG